MEKKKTVEIIIQIGAILTIAVALSLLLPMLTTKIFGIKTSADFGSFAGGIAAFFNLAAIYLVYLTYNTQTRQLEHQKEASIATINSQREQLEDQKRANSTTVGLLYLDELRDLLKDIIQQVNKFEFMDIKFNVHRGMDALKAFEVACQNSNSYKRYCDQDGKLLDAVNQIIAKVTFVGIQINSIEENIEKPYVSLLKNRVRVVLNSFLTQFEEVFDILRSDLKYIPDDNDLNFRDRTSINWLIYYLDQYTSNLLKLSEMGFVDRAIKNSVSFEEYYEASVNRQKHKKFEFNEYFRVPRSI